MLFVLLSPLAVSLWSTEAQADQVIDSFNDPLPEQTRPGDSDPITGLWAGTVAGVTQTQDIASQSELSGVLGGQRDTLVFSPNDNSDIKAIVNNGFLYYSTSFNTSGILELEYGGSADLNADLTADDSLAFEFEIEGDMNASKQVTLVVEVSSGSGVATDHVELALLASGVYQIPFADFPAVDFSDVDYMRFSFDASQVSRVDYLLEGGLRTTNCLQTPGAVVADVFLDSFEAPLPDHGMGGAGVAPFIWVGYGWGVLRPPIDIVTQEGLPGVSGGRRDTVLKVANPDEFAKLSARNTNGTPELYHTTGLATSGEMSFEYGASTNLDLDLSAHAAFEFYLEGDLDDGASVRPVDLHLEVISGTGSDTAQIQLTTNGRYVIPFSAFTGVDFGDIDFVAFDFDATAAQDVSYSLIGGFRASACE
ncbi:MAG: hypothetical protein AAGF11_41775 [Myxococcota bacterium]